VRAEAILIQRPTRPRPARNAFFALITFMAWLVWGVLWLPMITLIAWSVGLHNSYVELVVREHGKGWRDLVAIVLIAAVCAVITLLWSGYNRLRYGNLTRRRTPTAVSREAMAKSLKVSATTAREMRSQRRVVLEFLQDDSVVHQVSEVDALMEGAGRPVKQEAC
jgi:poly-beta-1,6-N-acetyl-D-glucosamine biosynthesis protein PgaD